MLTIAKLKQIIEKMNDDDLVLIEDKDTGLYKIIYEQKIERVVQLYDYGTKELTERRFRPGNIILHIENYQM